MKEKTTPHEQIVQMFEIIRKTSTVCGANIYHPKFKPGAITYLLFTNFILYFICIFYSIWLKYEEDWKIIFETGCLIDIGLQGLSKFLMALFNPAKIRQARAKVCDMYKYYETVNPKFRNILKKGVNKIKLVIFLNAAGWSSLALSMWLMPFYCRIFLNKRIFILNFYIPGLDPESESGYISLFSIQTMNLIFGLMGSIAGDAFFIIHALIMCVYSDITKQKIVEFNEFINKNDSNKLEIRYRFMDIVKFLQEYASYSDLVVETAYYVVNFQISCAAAGAIFSIYIKLAGDWPSSSLFFLISMMQVYVYCTIGTIVSIAADNVLEAVYEVQWYQLDVRDQKMLIYMLQNAQHPKIFTVSGLTDLSVNLALQVTKTIYSFLMMLLNFQE